MIILILERNLREKKWILIVEDEKDLAELMGEELQEEGFEYIHSSSAKDAKFKLDNQEFVCMLLDMNLEQGSGEDILRHIMRDKAVTNFSTPVLVISGNLVDSRIKEIKERIQGALVKPFDMETLINKIKSLI